MSAAAGSGGGEIRKIGLNAARDYIFEMNVSAEILSARLE
jgi:hypothetical protein